MALDLKEWVTSSGTELWWGRGSMIPALALGGGRERGGVNCYYFAIRTTGRIEMQFGSLKGKPGFETAESLQEFISRLNAIPGVMLREDAFTRFPSFDAASLLPTDSLKKFKAVIQWAVERCQTVWNSSVQGAA